MLKMGAEEVGIGLSVLKELAGASPFAVMLVLAFLLFYFMHKKSLDILSEYTEKAISEIRKAYHDANDMSLKTLEKR